MSFSMEFSPSLFSISPIPVQAFSVTLVSGTGFFSFFFFFFFLCLAETIISCYCHVPFPLKAIKNENPHFRTVSIKQAPFI